jgi:putative DNA primase/helicase
MDRIEKFCPLNYEVDLDTGVYLKLSSKEDDSQLLISPTFCLITAIGENIDTGEIVYKLEIRDIRHHSRILWKTTSDLMLRANVMKLLREGLHIKEANIGKMIDYFNDCINFSKDKFPAEIAASASGWKKNCSLFIVGNRGISVDGEIIEVLQQENPTAELYTQKGELEKWVGATNKLIKYPAVMFKLCTACAPPILKILNIKSFVETQQTPSGRLKTTMGKLAASMWGDPERLQLNAESTRAGILKTVEYSTDLPIFVDETSVTDSIKELVYLIANGVGRSKSNSEGGLVMPSTWSTVLLSTGEKPILPESALMGQQVRVVPLKEGVDEKLPASLIKEIQSTIATNYGHVGILFMQELFKAINDLNSRFQVIFNTYPEVDDITSERAKECYTIIELAGQLFKTVCEKIGVEAPDPGDVCKHYFNENVILNRFVPDYLKALEVSHSFFSTNEVYFREEDEEYPLNHERYGWVRSDDKHGKCICFDPEKLKNHLNTVIGPNTYEAVITEWTDRDILVPKLQQNKDTGAITKLKKNQISTPSGKKSVIKIPLKKFNEHLKLEEGDEEKSNLSSKSKDNNNSRVLAVRQAQTNLESQFVGTKVVNSISAFEEVVKDTAKTTSDDTELTELMTQGGFA